VKVSTKATYGILASLDLAIHNGSLPIQAKAIARRQAIPVRFLEQVLHSMKQAGLVESVRGAQGGYLLSRPSEKITLAEIVEALDGPLAPSRTRAFADRHRHRKHESLLAPVWERVRQAELTILNAVTLQELSDQQREQQRTLMYHI
jgi:Rrf2 family transcriptional regulator, cysteine metabolism repressor